MDIIDSLRFVKAAVAKKEIVEGLSHFSIKDNRVTSHNGVITLSSKINIDLNCNPKADAMLKAISSCNDTVVLKMTAAGRLSVKSGAFKANINCAEDYNPDMPEGELIPVNGEAYLKAFTEILPFVGTDAFAGRAFTTGILLHDKSMFATNNVIIAQYWLGQQLPHDITIPSIAIRELCKIKEAPTHIQLCKNNITFHFSEERWLKTVLLDAEWPDIWSMLDRPVPMKPVDTTLFDAIESIRAFCDKKSPKVIIESGLMRTHTELEEGASFQISDHSISAVFQPDMLYLLKGIATHIDLSDYTKPCLWQGGMLRGAIIGMRLL